MQEIHFVDRFRNFSTPLLSETAWLRISLIENLLIDQDF